MQGVHYTIIEIRFDPSQERDNLNFKLSSTSTPLERVVVIGATGFIGSSLCKFLGTASSCETVQINSSTLDLSKDYSIDSLTRLLRPNDKVVFLAAQTPDRGKDIDTFMINLSMIKNFNQAVQITTPAHITYVSSDSMFYPIHNGISIYSDQLTRNTYGLAHFARECFLDEKCSELNIPLAIVRPTAIYGFQNRQRTYGPNQFLKTIMENQEIVLFGDGEEQRDHLHIDDFNSYLFEILNKNGSGVIHIASGQLISFKEIANLFQATLPHMKIKIKTRARSIPFFHKSVDTAELKSLFPQISPLTPQVGITKEILAANTAFYQQRSVHSADFIKNENHYE